MWAIWAVGHSSPFHWSPLRWTAWKKAGADKAPRAQLGGQWNERWCSHLAALPQLMLAPAERLPALGLASEAAAGLLVSLQGHEICVSVHFELVWGLPPNFKSVLKSVNLRCRGEVHGVARAVWWQQCFLASGPLQVRAVISHPGVIRGKVSKEPGKGGLLSLWVLWGMYASFLEVISKCLTVRGNFQCTDVSSYHP